MKQIMLLKWNTIKAWVKEKNGVANYKKSKIVGSLFDWAVHWVLPKNPDSDRHQNSKVQQSDEEKKLN